MLNNFEFWFVDEVKRITCRSRNTFMVNTYQIWTQWHTYYIIESGLFTIRLLMLNWVYRDFTILKSDMMKFKCDYRKLVENKKQKKQIKAKKWQKIKCCREKYTPTYTKEVHCTKVIILRYGTNMTYIKFSYL